MEELKNEVISKIRSCLISTKGQVTLKQLQDDYRTLLGEKIPYSRLGHKTLESFIASVPSSLILSRSPTGQVFVDARVNEKTAHISSMVRKQKSATSKKKTVRIAPRYNQFNHRTHHTQPPPVTNKWRPQQRNFVPSSRQSWNNNPRLAVHNQFVNAYPKPSVPSKIVVPEKKVVVQPPPQPLTPPMAPSPPRELRRYNSTPERSESDVFGGEDGGGDKESCPVFTSTMKRMSRLMSGISVERDSGNSSPTTEYAVNYKSFVQEFTKTGDVIVDLKNFAAYHKLGDVEVKFTETKPKKSKISQFHCKIKVGQHTYSSYPNDFFNKEGAELHASRKALDDLIQKHSRRKSLLISSNDDIIERVPPMLEKHQGAVWMWQIEADYIDKYNEQLPSDWLQVIDSSLYVSIEKCLGGYVLKHCNPDDKGKKLDVSLNLGDVSVPCNTVQFSDSSNRLYAVVTAALSSNEIWCQQCGTAEFAKFVEMNEKMEDYYSKNKDELVSKEINFGSCYVIFHENNWMRVRVISSLHEGFVGCFLIDYGEVVDVPAQNIYSLRREFALEQAQAFVCRLDGLEEFYDASVDSDHLMALVGKEFVLEMVVDEAGDNTDLTIPVVMYDLNTGSSINEELIGLFTIDSATPILDKNVITEVYVSNIESNGDVYVQIRTPGYYSLLELLQQIETNITKAPPIEILSPVTKQNSENRIYLVKSKMSNKWLRATILDWSPRGDMAQIYFVDYGNTDVVSISHELMFPLDKIDDVVNQYPWQAIKVRIMIEKIPRDFVERASKLMPHDQMILLKIISYDNEKVAWVEFFKRSSDGGLFCINKSISVEVELQNIDDGNNIDKNSRKRLMSLVQFNDGSKNVPSGGSLKKPDLPKKGDYFNVNIPFSVNPWNFFVQPLDTLDKLTALMAEMQERYKQYQSSPLQIDDIIPGKIYASKHEDGLWYRTSVLKVIHSGCISVFYCDFGYYTSLTLAQLVPLDIKFMDFPYQALKAKIAGIQPIKNKWTMEDCDFFNSLVTKKQFVSILINIEKDELYRSDMILQLLLIDTSSDEDVNIKEILIERGMATSVG